MHLRTTFFLLILAALIFSFICFYEISDNNESTKTGTEIKLLDFDPERVNYWSFADDKGFIECLNEHGQWMIAKPVKICAKNARINYMLSVLAALPKGETITEHQRKARALSIADYGLENPRVRIVLGSSNKRILINVGNVSPLKDSIYVQINSSDTIVATVTNLLNIIPRDLTDVRDTHLLSGAPAYVKRLEIKSQKHPPIVVVKEGSEWILRKPVMARADWLKVSGLLDSLFNAEIEQYITDTMTDPSLYGLNDDESILHVGVWQNENENGEYLIFGKKADEKGRTVYVCQRGQNSVFTVKAGVINSLAVTAGGIRDSRLFFMAPDLFSSIRIEEDNNILRLARDSNSDWQIIEPKKWKADNKVVATLIARLNSLRVEMFISGTNFNAQLLEKPAKIISVSDTMPLPFISNQPPSVGFGELGPSPTVAAPPAGTTRTLLLSAPIPGQECVLGRFADEDEAYHLSVSAVATISINPMIYRDSTILSFDPAAVTKIVLCKNNKEQIVVRGDSGAWKAVQPPAAPVNQKVIYDLLAKTAGLRAMRFERSGNGAAGIYGLQPALRTLTLSLSGKEGIAKTLLFGENSEDGGVYAMLQGQEIVFVLDKKLVNLLLHDFLQ
ncbi:MAG: DUF4340 domain-containing protein [Kiritimatiellia bacterium]|nr:DUF4340 domain-containing protein [Kiritimatiellia bacterium]